MTWYLTGVKAKRNLQGLAGPGLRQSFDLVLAGYKRIDAAYLPHQVGIFKKK